jgi:hypothetical protein
MDWLASDYFGPPVTPLASYAASAAPGCAVPGFGAARLPPQAPADWLRGSGRVPSPPFPPALRHCALRPQTAGAKGLRLRSRLRRARIHHRQTVSASSDRLAQCPLLAWLPFVTACAGALAGSAIAQPAAPPHCAGLSRPRLSVVSIKVWCCLPNQGRWSAIEHNAGIMRSAKTALYASPHNLHYV